MDNSHRHFTRAAQAVLAVAAMLACACTLAAAPVAAADSQASVGPASARCRYGPSHAGRDTCLTKAEYALTRSRQTALDRDPAQYLRNALQRCGRLNGDDKTDCVARIQGQGTTSGSVEGGGIYRELVTREVGAPGSGMPQEAGPDGAKK